MDSEDKRLSKLYRKMLTSNESKAFFIFEKLNPETKRQLKGKLKQNGSKQAIHLLEKLNQIVNL